MPTEREQPRKRAAVTGPDAAELAIWETADLVERLREKAGSAVAQEAARAGLAAVRAFETHIPPDGRRRPPAQGNTTSCKS